MADSKMTMQGLAGTAIGVLALIVAFTIIPIVGSQLDASITLPAAGTAGANWNSTNNANIVTAVSVWQAVGGILKVGGIIVVVAGFLTTLRGLRG